MDLYLCNNPKAIAALSALAPWGLRSRGGSTVQQVGLVGIIQIRGPIAKYPGREIINTSPDLVAAINEAADDEMLQTIVLWTDSPGGTTDGTEELARTVADAARRKTVIGLVDGVAASAAYWVLSQATKIYATNRTDEFGSIGVFYVLQDLSEQAKMLGIKVHVIASGPLKGAGVPGTEITEEQLAQFRKRVHATKEEFVLAVSKGRRIPADQVRAMATGATWTTAEAKRLGLIDGQSSLDQIISDAHADVRRLADASQRFYAILEESTSRGMGACQARAVVNAMHPDVAADAAKFESLHHVIKSQFKK